jgi:hypothetical protein
MSDMWGRVTNVQGHPLEEARSRVLKLRRRKRLENIAADLSENALIRDAAALELHGPARRA